MAGIGFGISPNFRRLNSGGGYTAIMTDYITRVTAEGGTLTDTEKTAINLLTQNADIGEFDRLWVHGLQNQIAARTSVVNALTADLITNVNSTTFTAGQGFTGNGTTMYLNTNYSPAVDGVKFTRNSACFGNYTRLNQQNTSLYMGVLNGSYISQYNPDYTGLGYLYIINAGSNTFASSQITQGLFSLVRTGSTASKSTKNGVDVSTNTTASAALSNNNFFILARNNTGTPDNLSPQQISLSFIGSGAVDQAQFYTDVQTLATTLGFNV